MNILRGFTDWLLNRRSTEQRLLAQLRAVTVSEDEYLERLGQAVLIGQAGGVSDEHLVALLHLVAVGQFTPSLVDRLDAAGLGWVHGPVPSLVELLSRPGTRVVVSRGTSGEVFQTGPVERRPPTRMFRFGGDGR